MDCLQNQHPDHPLNPPQLPPPQQQLNHPTYLQQPQRQRQRQRQQQPQQQPPQHPQQPQQQQHHPQSKTYDT